MGLRCCHTLSVGRLKVVSEVVLTWDNHHAWYPKLIRIPYTIYQHITTYEIKSVSMIQDQEWVAPVIQQPGSDAFESMVYSSKIESEPKYPNRSYHFPIFLYLYIIQVITPVWKGTLVPYSRLYNHDTHTCDQFRWRLILDHWCQHFYTKTTTFTTKYPKEAKEEALPLELNLFALYR